MLKADPKQSIENVTFTEDKAAATSDDAYQQRKISHAGDQR